MNSLNKYLLISLLFIEISFAQIFNSYPSALLKNSHSELVSESKTEKKMLKQVQQDIQHADLEKQFEFAKKLFDEENYFDAITEFKRLQFFDTSNVYKFASNELIALCYKYGGKFNEAIKYLTLAAITANSKDDLYRIRIEIIRINILRRTTDNALKLLDEIGNDERWGEKKDEINYWRGWSYIFADEWDKASQMFARISLTHELKILCDSTDEKKYSPTFAKVASVILPGAGQFYTGKYLSGFISFGWCALWGYTAVNAFVGDRIFDGLAVTNFLWLRFYQGNLQNAEKFVGEKNIQITNEALYFLQHNYLGLKP